MADSDQPVTEHVLEPSPFGNDAAAPEHYPFLFSFQGEDVLELTSWNSAAGVRVTIQGRIHVAPLSVKPFTHTHVANTDRSAKTTVVSLPRGELLNCIAFVSSGTPLLGQTFVRVAVRRGADTAFERLGVLIQRPITSTVFAAFPGSVVISPLEAEPFIRTITGTAPGANVDIVETVPTGARWLLQGLRFTMTTTNGGHPIKFRFKDSSGNTVGGCMTSLNANVTPSVNEFIGTAGNPQTYANTLSSEQELFSPLPYPLIMLAGGSFSATYASAWQFSAPNYSVAERLEI